MNEYKLAQLTVAMTEFYSGEAKRVQHFMKVHGFARTIAALENMDPAEKYVLEAAAIVHDIGIKPSEEKYGNCFGQNQEKEGPPVARTMLKELGFNGALIERVCWLVGHHHTYAPIEGMDHQILVEADFLVNLFEGNKDRETIYSAYNKIFKTKSGKQLCKNMFALEEV